MLLMIFQAHPIVCCFALGWTAPAANLCIGNWPKSKFIPLLKAFRKRNPPPAKCSVTLYQMSPESSPQGASPHLSFLHPVTGLYDTNHFTTVLPSQGQNSCFPNKLIRPSQPTGLLTQCPQLFFSVDESSGSQTVGRHFITRPQTDTSQKYIK